MKLLSGLCFSLSLIVSAAGCSDAPPLVPVSGKVTLDDKPAADVLVRLIPTDGPADWVAEGRTDSQGVFRLQYRDGSDGAPVGQFKVTLSTERGDVEGGETFQPRYYDSDKTVLSLTVPEGGATDISLKASSSRQPKPNPGRFGGA